MKKALLVLIFLFSSLEAGWGAKDSTHTFEETEWRDVYYTGTRLSCIGILPNYDAVLRPNDFESYFDYIKVNNRVGLIDDRVYIIQIAPKSIPIKSGREFKEVLKNSHPDIHPGWLDAKKIGAKYALEFTSPLADGNMSYWRVIYKNNRLFALGTSDENEARRNHFFESFHVK